MTEERPSTEAFVHVTELAGQSMSIEQRDRLCHRYRWATTFCDNRDVIELACGGGQGLGLLASHAKSIRGADISPEVLQRAIDTYGDTIPLEVLPAENTPYPKESFDVILLFEAIYYLPDARCFALEALRLLRPGGMLLIVTANKDLYDFTRSPYSTTYYGVVELSQILEEVGFDTGFFGYVDVNEISWRQKLFRPVKALASKLRLVPKTMIGKSFLKNIIFGEMVPMPSRIEGLKFNYFPPKAIASNEKNLTYKVIYCTAKKA